MGLYLVLGVLGWEEHPSADALMAMRRSPTDRSPGTPRSCGLWSEQVLPWHQRPRPWCIRVSLQAAVAKPPGPSRPWALAPEHEGLFQKQGQRVVPGLGRPQTMAVFARPHPTRPHPSRRVCGEYRGWLQTRAAGLSWPAHSCSTWAPAPGTAPVLASPLARESWPSPTWFPPSQRLGAALVAQGQARAAEEQPVKGSPYEWAFI